LSNNSRLSSSLGSLQSTTNDLFTHFNVLMAVHLP